MAARADDRAMISEKVAPILVARTLSAFDLIVIFVGIVAFLTFLITGGFVTAQLGRMFPEEGSLYVWTHKVLGPFWGFFAGFVAWWPGPLVMVAAGILVANFAQQVAVLLNPDCPAPCILTENWHIGLVVLAVVWFSTAMSVLKMRVTQNYVNVQFFFYATAIFLIGLAGVIWLLGGNESANSFSTGWNPFRDDLGHAALGIPANLTFFSFTILALLGIETPMNMGVEINGGERAIRTYLFWGCIIVMVAYLWTTWGTMVTVPLDTLNGTTGGAQGVAIAMGKWLGVFVAVVLAWVFLTAAVVYNFAFARLLFVSGLEKRLPEAVGKVNRNQVPANAVYLQAAIATITAIMIFFVLGRGESDPYKYFYALYAGLTIVWCISTALLFLDVFFAKRANPTRFEQARRVPEWVLYVSGAVGSIINIVAVFFIFTGSWYPPGCPSLTEWNLWMLGISLVSIVACVLIYLLSQQARRGLSDEELIARGAAEQEIAQDMPSA